MLSAVLMLGSLCPSGSTAQSFDHERFARVLDQHATEKGVRYSDLRADPGLLHAYLEQLASVTAATFDGWSRADQVAYLINAYNAHAIGQVVAHYPIRRSLNPAALLRPANSVWQISGFFDGVRHRVAGRDLTLDDIEHEWLRGLYREPRIHAALVCAARSCPPLRLEPYDGSRLEAQLEEQMRRFVTDRAANRFDRQRNVVQLSSIFDWFGEDFRSFAPAQGYRGDRDERGVLAFLSRYLPPELVQWLQSGRYRIEYLDYDWTLNEG